MAIYHLHVSTISRTHGRSAPAAAAYRSARKIVEHSTGEVHDYRRKLGVSFRKILVPEGAPEWAKNRTKLWNAAEAAERRKDSTVAREFEISLPAELTMRQRRRLAVDFAREIVEKHGCAADVCIHAPSRTGNQNNHHAHILLTTRRINAEGLHAKTRELDERKSGLIVYWRERYATLQNERLLEFGSHARVSHLTLKAQGIDRVPTYHLGPVATAYERRTGKPSTIRQHELKRSQDLKEQAAQEFEAEQQPELDQSLKPFAEFKEFLRTKEGFDLKLDESTQFKHPIYLQDFRGGISEAEVVLIDHPELGQFAVYAVDNETFMWKPGQNQLTSCAYDPIYVANLFERVQSIENGLEMTSDEPVYAPKEEPQAPRPSWGDFGM